MRTRLHASAWSGAGVGIVEKICGAACGVLCEAPAWRKVMTLRECLDDHRRVVTRRSFIAGTKT
jgi:hypothetical protein